MLVTSWDALFLTIAACCYRFTVDCWLAVLAVSMAFHHWSTRHIHLVGTINIFCIRYWVGPGGRGGAGLDENIQVWNCRKFWTTPKSLCTSKLWCGIEDKGKCLRDKLLLLLPEVAKSKSTNKVQECWDCPVHIYWIDWFSTVGSCCWYCCCCSHKMVLPSFLVVRSC